MQLPATLTDSTGGSATTTLAAATNTAAVTAITDNGGGAAADGTIAAITLTEPANLAAQTTINNQLADAVKELSTKLNLAITELATQRTLNTVLINCAASLASAVNSMRNLILAQLRGK